MAAPTADGIGASHSHPALKPIEYLTMILKSPYLLATVSFTFINQLFLRRNFSLRGLKVALILAAGRSMPPNLTIRQLHYLVPTTGKAATSYCKTHKISLSSVLLDAGPNALPGRLHFLGVRPPFATNDPSKRILLYIHGGGFVFPATSGHFAFATIAAHAAHAELAMLEYTVTLGTPYAAQLAQAATAIRHLLDERGFAPSQILVGGDSAGGRIILGLLSHLKVARQGVPPLPIGGTHPAKLLGALLISPGCSHDATTENSRANDRYDVLSQRSFDVFLRVFRAATGGIETNPLYESASHWEDLAVERVLVTAGRRELLYDGIVRFAKLLQARSEKDAKIRIQVNDVEVHAQPVLEAGVGILDGAGTCEILSWLQGL